NPKYVRLWPVAQGRRLFPLRCLHMAKVEYLRKTAPREVTGAARLLRQAVSPSGRNRFERISDEYGKRLCSVSPHAIGRRWNPLPDEYRRWAMCPFAGSDCTRYGPTRSPGELLALLGVGFPEYGSAVGVTQIPCSMTRARGQNAK